MIPLKLVKAIISQYGQSLNGLHGIAHWARVLENGRRLAKLSGAKIQVTELFAVFHDSRRVKEGRDPGHGLRGADLADSLRKSLFDLSEEDFDLLYAACRYHTDGLTEADITIQTCWDADRLDLARAGIIPDPDRMCLEAAKDPAIIDWAVQRSLSALVPDPVGDEWKYNLDDN